MQHRRLMWYRASSGITYEIRGLTEHRDSYLPLTVREDVDGRIHDCDSSLSWDSLMAMTQDLRLEITEVESDPGN